MEEKNINNESNDDITKEPGDNTDIEETAFAHANVVDETEEENTETIPNEAKDTADLKEQSTAEEELITDIPEAAYAFRWDYGEQKRYDDGAHTQQRKKSRGALTFAIILSITLILSFTALTGVILLGDYLNPNGYSRPSADFADDLNALYEHCLPSYVAISITKNSGASGAGSGIIITEDGYISTNYHVVEDTEEITVILSNGKKYTAEYIDGDEINDIAVIKISATGLTPAKLGNSKEVKVGDRVMAIGTPYSITYSGSMTAGYVSGVDRVFRDKNENGTVSRTLKLLQTDTSLNPGNSGGPLFNMDGEVVGVVTLKIAGQEYEGMGFAIPINGVKAMIFDIIENGKITDKNAGSATEGAALGIGGLEALKDEKYLFTDDDCFYIYSDDNGEYIQVAFDEYSYSTQKIYLTDSDALQAVGIINWTPYITPSEGILILETNKGFDSYDKLKIADLIISVNGMECHKMETLQEVIFDSRIGDKLQLEVYRNGEILDIEVELGRSNSME